MHISHDIHNKETQTPEFKTKSPNFLRTNCFILEVQKFHSFCKDNPKILENINKPTQTIKDTGNTYRIINHWESLGLINNDRENSDKGWRKFSIADLAWISIIKILREFGLSSDKIRITKECLNEQIASKPNLNWLEYAFYRAYAIKKDGGNTYLLIFCTGQAVVTTSNEISANKSLSFIPNTYITINLNQLFHDNFKLPKMTEKHEYSFELTEEEINAMSAIRTSGVDKINIRLKSGKISLIEKVFEGKKDDFKSLHEFIGDISHGEATLKIENGKVIYIQALQKEKIGDKK